MTIHRASAVITPAANAAVRGRYVRIELPGKARILSLAEVKLLSSGANIAGEGAVTQSSTDFDGEAKRAIDGNTSGDYAANTVTHTRQSDDPWWELDLQASRDVDPIEIWNRTLGLEDRLQGAVVILLDENRKPVWQQTLAAAPKPNTLLKLSPGRAVEIAAAFTGDGGKFSGLEHLAGHADAKNKAKPAAPRLKRLCCSFSRKPPSSQRMKPCSSSLKSLRATPVTLAIETTSDVHAPRIAETPDSITTILLKPAAWRSAEEQAALVGTTCVGSRQNLPRSAKPRCIHRARRDQAEHRAGFAGACRC